MTTPFPTLPFPLSYNLPLTPNGPKLATRIYRNPTKSTSTPPPIPKIALIAHPYGPLGGSYDDPTVLLTVQTLLAADYAVVGTFNFRRPSWSLASEVGDVVSFAVFLVGFCLSLSLRLRDAGGGAGTRTAMGEQKMHLTIAGYSYGAFVARQVPCAADMLGRMSTELKNNLMAQVELALALALGGAVSSTTENADAGSLDRLKITTSYLLISPLLAPVTRLLAPFNRSDMLVGRVAGAGSTERFPALAVFGTEDVFTSSRRLVQWAELHGIEAAVIDGADHFWQDDGHRARLQSILLEWLKRHDTG